MTTKIEYRVRAVTRFIVTKHDPDKETTDKVCEVDAQYVANRIAEGLALEKLENGREAVAVPLHEALPGKVMRCKVFLGARQANLAYANYENGTPRGRTITHGEGERASVVPDPTDPANWRGDGEQLSFYAVCAGFNPQGVPNVEENRIFGYWSPSVEMKMTVRNQAVLDALEQGAEYYVDFTPAPKASQP